MRLAVTNNGTLLSSNIDTFSSTDLSTSSIGVQAGSWALAASGATAGSFGAVVVNAKGQVTSSLTTIATGDATGTSSGASLGLSLATLTGTGTYSNIVTDGKGRVTAARAVNLTDVTTGLGYTPLNITHVGVTFGAATLDANADLTPAQFPTVTMTGDVTATVSSGTITTTLKTIGSVATYSSMMVGVEGRIWSGSYVLNNYQTGTIGVTSTTTNFTPANAAPTQGAMTLLWSRAITPSSATTSIMVQMDCFVDTSQANPILAIIFSAANGSTITLAIFRGTACIGVTMKKILTTSSPGNVEMTLFDIPATTASTTYSCYYAGSSGTTYINQTNGYTLGNGGGTSVYSLLDLGQ